MTALPAATQHCKAAPPGELSGSIGDDPVVDSLPNHIILSPTHLPSYLPRSPCSGDMTAFHHDGSAIARTEIEVPHTPAREPRQGQVEVEAVETCMQGHTDTMHGTHEHICELRTGRPMVSCKGSPPCDMPLTATKPRSDPDLVIVSEHYIPGLVVQTGMARGRSGVDIPLKVLDPKTADASTPDACRTGELNQQRHTTAVSRCNSATTLNQRNSAKHHIALMYNTGSTRASRSN